MATDLNPNDVVMWMRERAQWFTEMANRIEKDCKTSLPVAPAQSVPLPERIRNLLADGKARRAPHIAKALGVPANQVRKIVEGNGLLKRNERGWITLVKEVQDG